MSLFHTHKFKEQSRKFTPRAAQVTSLSGSSEENLQEVLFGFTTVELVCSECGDIKFVKSPGDQSR